MFFSLILLVFFILFVYLAHRNILWALLLIAAFPYSYLIRFQVFGIPMTILEGMILITFIVWFGKKICHSEQSEESIFQQLKRSLGFAQDDEVGNKWRLAIGLFLLAATISVFVSPNTRAALGVWKAYFIEPFLFFLIFINTVKSKEEKEKVVWALVLGALPVAILAVIQKFTGWLIPNPFWAAEATRRVTGVFGYPNAVALYLAPLIPFALYLFMEHGTWNMEHKKQNFFVMCFMLCAMCLMLLAIVFAQSTGALIAIVATTVIFGLIYKKTRWWAAGLTILFLAMIPFTSFREPLSQEVLLRGASGQIRLAMWGETVEMLRARPIFGAGLSGYQQAVAPYHILSWAEIYLYPHNLFLNFWTETGLLGLVGFLLIVWNFFKFIFKKLIGNWKLEIGNLKSMITDKSLLIALMSSMIIIVIHGLVDVPYFKNDLSVIFWLFLALSIA